MSTTPLTRRQAILRNIARGLYVVPLRLLLLIPFWLLAELLWCMERALSRSADFADDIRRRLHARLPGLLPVPPTEAQLEAWRARAAGSWGTQYDGEDD